MPDELEALAELNEYMDNVLLNTDKPLSFDEFLERLEDDISKDASWVDIQNHLTAYLVR